MIFKDEAMTNTKKNYITYLFFCIGEMRLFFDSIEVLNIVNR